MMGAISAAKAACPLDDRGILGSALQPEDASYDYVSGSNYYGWHWALGYAFRPARIGEIGVMYGYSLLAMWRGATAAGVTPELYGYDIDPDRLARAAASCRESGAEAIFTCGDTQAMDALPSGAPFDLFYVDGDHRTPSARHDLELAFEAIAPGGVIALDDVGGPSAVGDPELFAGVRWAGDSFATAHGLTPIEFHTFRGMYVFHVPEDGR